MNILLLTFSFLPIEHSISGVCLFLVGGLHLRVKPKHSVLERIFPFLAFAGFFLIHIHF